MSFVAAVPPAPQSPDNTTVSAGSWWGEVDCNAMRDALRLGDVVTHTRLVDAIRGGIITVTDELREWRSIQIAAGHAVLADVEPDDEVDGVNRLVLLFQRAVQFSAATELAELNRDATATTELLGRADTDALTAPDYRRLATNAIRDILGTTRTAVELI